MFLAIAVALPLHDLQYGPQAAFISESFPGSLRYSGSSLGYQLASITAGGPAPILAVLLLREFGTSTAIAVYMSVCALISLACVYALPDRAGNLDHHAVRSVGSRQSLPVLKSGQATAAVVVEAPPLGRSSLPTADC